MRQEELPGASWEIHHSFVETWAHILRTEYDLGFQANQNK